MGKNHTSYFDNAAVVGWLHCVITDPALDRDPQCLVAPTLPPPPAGVREHERWAKWAYRGVLAYPLAVLAALIAGGLGGTFLAGLAWVVSAVLLVAMVWNVAGRARRHANPFMPRST